jgi:uncharacterized protein HemX
MSESENGSPVTARELYQHTGRLIGGFSIVVVTMFGMVMWLHNDQQTSSRSIRHDILQRINREATRSQEARAHMREDADVSIRELENAFDQWKMSVAPLDAEQSMLIWSNCERIGTLMAAFANVHMDVPISMGAQACPQPSKRNE